MININTLINTIKNDDFTLALAINGRATREEYNTPHATIYGCRFELIKGNVNPLTKGYNVHLNKASQSYAALKGKQYILSGTFRTVSAAVDAVNKVFW